MVLVLDYFQLFNFLKSPIDQVITPVKREIFSKISGVSAVFNVAGNFNQLVKFYNQKEKMVQQNEELKLKVKQLQEENLKLRVQLESPFPASFKFVPARVVAVSRFMEIDSGISSGIKKGQYAVDGETLVGIVESVSAARSTIKLVTDPDFVISAITNRGTKGLVAGQGEQNIALTKVLQKDPLFLDDQVVTTGEEFVPANLLIGKISYITQEETATYKQARIFPLLNYGQERVVFVITAL